MSRSARSERSDGTRTVERQLWRDAPAARRLSSAAIVLAAAAAFCWIAVALLLSGVVADVFVAGASLRAVAGPIVLMVVLVLARSALLWASALVAQRSAEAVKIGLRERLAVKLLRLGPIAVRGARTGELVYAVGEGVESLDAYVTRYVPARTLVIVVPLGIALVVLALDRLAFGILLVTGPVLVVLLGLIGRRISDLAERREHELAWMNAHFLDVLRGLPTLKLFGRAADQADRIELVSRRHGAATMDVLRIAFQTTLVLEWGTTAATALVAIEASARLMGGGIGFGQALAALLLTPEFFLPLRRLSAEHHVGRSGAAALRRISAILDEPERIASRVGRDRPRLPEPLEIRIEDVWVAYEEGKRPALSGCSVELPSGRTLALVGPSGSGKTTIANVLLGFVEPDRGTVMVDGKDLADIELSWWREHVAYVPQHPTLFHGSVAENLRLARPGATDDELAAAARIAGAHRFVTELPEGYATPIGEGGWRLSGGERQRVAIARAVLRDAPVLILDEPTSHLDGEVETAVLDGLARFAKGRTTLLITHHPATAFGVDLVAPMDRGRVAQTRVPGRSDGRDGLEPSVVFGTHGRQG